MKQKKNQKKMEREKKKSHEVLLVLVCFDPGIDAAWDPL